MDVYNKLNPSYYVEDCEISKIKDYVKEIVCIYGDNDPYIPQDVLKSNLQCFLCRRGDCTLRYIPQRKLSQYYDGTRYTIRCKKDQEAHEKAILNK